MAPLALALQLVLATPTLAPPLDPGPFRGGELALASAGALGGDLLVAGTGYLALTLFAQGVVDPSAANFRRAALVLGVSALLVPPLTAVLLARVGLSERARGGFWKAMLLAVAGQAAALVVGYYAAPHFWLVLPAQLAGVSIGTSFGLHWGRARLAAPGLRAAPPLEREPADDAGAAPATAGLALFPICLDG
jgi:hypothetical protein